MLIRWKRAIGVLAATEAPGATAPNTSAAIASAVETRRLIRLLPSRSSARGSRIRRPAPTADVISSGQWPQLETGADPTSQASAGQRGTGRSPSGDTAIDRMSRGFHAEFRGDGG